VDFGPVGRKDTDQLASTPEQAMLLPRPGRQSTFDSFVDILSGLTRRKRVTSGDEPASACQESSVPHPFNFFLSNGWDTSKLNPPVS